MALSRKRRTSITTATTVAQGQAVIGQQSTQESAVPAPSRRRFLSRIWLALGGILAAELASVGLGFLRPRARHRHTENQLAIAGPVERFEPGSVKAFADGGFYLARLPDGGFLALARECTHLGCTVAWNDASSRFICPCHASAFDLQGSVVSPPAPRALDRYAVRIENGIVKVDTACRSRRQAVAATQVAMNR